MLYEEGLLTGYRIVVKDNINVRGFCTSAGTKALEHYKPTADATVVEKLKAAGAIVIGITLFSIDITYMRTYYHLDRNWIVLEDIFFVFM